MATYVIKPWRASDQPDVHGNSGTINQAQAGYVCQLVQFLVEAGQRSVFQP